MHRPRSGNLLHENVTNSSQKSTALICHRREHADRTIGVSFKVNGGERGARLYRRVDRTL